MPAKRENLYRDVLFLTSIVPPRNYKNIRSLNKAAGYIEAEFKKTGFPVHIQSWDVQTRTYKNIIASWQPEKSKRFVIGAHYDVYKNIPGADDNASSVAGLLEIARLLSRQKPKMDYGIDCVAFSLEEPPFFKTKNMGSYIHARSISKENRKTIGLIALEMIGYFGEPHDKNSGQNLLIVSGIRKYDSFNKKISDLLKISPELNSRRLSFTDDYRNNGPSDHRNYWQYNIPAAMVIGTSGTGNPHYHKESDTIETLDFETMTRAVNSLFYMVSNFEKT